MASKAPKAVKPLGRFDFGLVNQRLEVVFINVSRDLERRARKAQASGDADADRCLVLLQIMIRFAWNSYHAVAYLAADIPEDSARKPTYVLMVPAINRQLLDLLFSLAYMLDDFRKRSLKYQQAGWRELLDEEQQFRTAFSSDTEWQPHFHNLRSIRDGMVERFFISPEQQKTPTLVPYWKTPQYLKDAKTKCRPFLRYLAKWLYKDTSAQAHLSFGGLFPLAAFLLPEIVTDQHDKFLWERSIQQYRFTHIARTAVIFLAIATEIDTSCNLQNHAAVDYLWTIFAEYVAEAKEMWELRYAKRFN